MQDRTASARDKVIYLSNQRLTQGPLLSLLATCRDINIPGHPDFVSDDYEEVQLAEACDPTDHMQILIGLLLSDSEFETLRLSSRAQVTDERDRTQGSLRPHIAEKGVPGYSKTAIEVVVEFSREIFEGVGYCDQFLVGSTEAGPEMLPAWAINPRHRSRFSNTYNMAMALSMRAGLLLRRGSSLDAILTTECRPSGGERI
ncbi:hypothetical protein MKZ38_004562 [Zalerion maritima]|uniref:Uncharacterized protein n=1 Tax=Zalerion maritima TaxID=339359 RepID=A0AAD5RS86_9PEZI|nr:hypothetical protein MKZ38_004562 [Zalerion maritima]